MSAQDAGGIPQEFFDDLDYEFWVTVKSEDKDKVLLLLVEKLFGDKFHVMLTSSVS